ncbi:MAG TPA: PIN domain-containing protein [Blastocatellia bacterium]|nr:PIN domain-containing protein [Blastocatellia bacterium]HMV81839.1 PIN domain-containing protein [Blastocatellia bacterium]HMX23980.1 PIN domain-containing protein [Blastocatellia bacterium]HMY75214.1 PIN domain-containing protein [Blastocatellia bacterium]HMZ22918.1 PIN domain-containing protein [Blastocatellia bacterium]
MVAETKQSYEELKNPSKSFPRRKIEKTISDRAIQLLKLYRLSHGLLIPDALIAATALEHNELLISKNQRDFRFISGLQLLPYP